MKTEKGKERSLEQGGKTEYLLSVLDLLPVNEMCKGFSYAKKKIFLFF